MQLLAGLMAKIDEIYQEVTECESAVFHINDYIDSRLLISLKGLDLW